MPSLEQLRLAYKLTDFELLYKDNHYDPYLKISFNNKYVEIIYDDSVKVLNLKDFHTLVMHPAIHSILSK